ncbi:MAG: hypothetical protein R6V30_13815, partial [Paracoccaceae bacterium]
EGNTHIWTYTYMHMRRKRRIPARRHRPKPPKAGEDLYRTAANAKSLKGKAFAPDFEQLFLRSRTGVFHRIGGECEFAALATSLTFNCKSRHSIDLRLATTDHESLVLGKIIREERNDPAVSGGLQGDLAALNNCLKPLRSTVMIPRKSYSTAPHPANGHSHRRGSVGAAVIRKRGNTSARVVGDPRRAFQPCDV